MKLQGPKYWRVRFTQLATIDDLKILILFGISLGLGWALCAQGTFLLVQNIQAQQAVSTLQSQFRVSLSNSSDFALLGQSIEDLERLGLVRCSQLVYQSDPPATILDTSFRHPCVDSSLSLSGQKIEIQLETINGSRFRLASSTVNQPSFYIALWLMRILGWAIIILLLAFFRSTSRHKEKLHQMKLENADSLNRISAQVSHDIRSPLSALNLLVGMIKGLPEEQRAIMRTATQRINDIANQLLQKSKALENQPELKPKPVMLSSLIDSLVSEKRMQYRDRIDVEITADLSAGYGVFVDFSRTELARAISNLVNNSMEALPAAGCVTIRLKANTHFARIEIQDNGTGIPPEMLAKIGERGVTFGKKGGSGLGAHHARKVTEDAGGHFNVTSVEKLGTLVTLDLPRTKTPSWFVDHLLLTGVEHVVSFDDDQTIHKVWSNRFRAGDRRLSRINHLSFSALNLFEAWIATGPHRNTLYLFDYELIGQKLNGLDLIERFDLSRNSVLVTSHFEEESICARAEALGVKILPKSLAHFIPLTVKPGA